jgi:hypothetical protein
MPSVRAHHPASSGLLPRDWAVELQEGDQHRVETNVKETTERLVDLGAETVVLGCAGMGGMGRWVIDAGPEKGKMVRERERRCSARRSARRGDATCTSTMFYEQAATK